MILDNTISSLIKSSTITPNLCVSLAFASFAVGACCQMVTYNSCIQRGYSPESANKYAKGLGWGTFMGLVILSMPRNYYY